MLLGLSLMVASAAVSDETFAQCQRRLGPEDLYCWALDDAPPLEVSADEMADKAVAEAEAGAQVIAERVNAMVAWETCLNHHVSALTYFAQWRPEMALKAAIEGCSEEESNFRYRTEVSLGHSPDMSSWYRDNRERIMVHALTRGEIFYRPASNSRR